MMLSTSILWSVLFEKQKKTILQSNIQYDIMFLPKRSSFLHVDESGVGYRLSL